MLLVLHYESEHFMLKSNNIGGCVTFCLDLVKMELFESLVLHITPSYEAFHLRQDE